MEQPAEKLTRRLEAELELTRDQRAGLAWLDEIDTAIKDIRRVYRPSLRCGPGFGPPKGQESGPSTLDGLLRKQGGLCFYCGRQMVMVRGEGNALGLRATLEHRFARSRGGTMSPMIASAIGKPSVAARSTDAGVPPTAIHTGNWRSGRGYTPRLSMPARCSTTWQRPVSSAGTGSKAPPSSRSSTSPSTRIRTRGRPRRCCSRAQARPRHRLGKT